jgi:DNA-binding GntR family transcriptional regulator
LMTAARAEGDAGAGPLHRRVLESLSQAFMQGDFVPGQKLTLRELAGALGTSIAPVREAIGRLSALGVVTVHPKRHIEVEPLTPGLYIELVEVRKLLEGHAAAQAATRATDAELTAIAIINRRLLKSAKRGEVRRAMKENQLFHFAVYQAARSRALLEAIEHLWLRAGPSLNLVLAEAFSHDRRSLSEGFDSHRGLIRALKARDPGSALRAVTADIEVSAGYLLAGLRRQLPSTADTVTQVAARRRPRPRRSGGGSSPGTRRSRP